jgi:Spy/CpxP family protein refolding chaperone
MKRRLTAALLLASLVVALFATTQGSATSSPRPPAGFFGIGPQMPFDDADASYMRAGGIDSAHRQRRL